MQSLSSSLISKQLFPFPFFPFRIKTGRHLLLCQFGKEKPKFCVGTECCFLFHKEKFSRDQRTIEEKCNHLWCQQNWLQQCPRKTKSLRVSNTQRCSSHVQPVFCTHYFIHAITTWQHTSIPEPLSLTSWELLFIILSAWLRYQNVEFCCVPAFHECPGRKIGTFAGASNTLLKFFCSSVLFQESSFQGEGRFTCIFFVLSSVSKKSLYGSQENFRDETPELRSPYPVNCLKIDFIVQSFLFVWKPWMRNVQHDTRTTSRSVQGQTTAENFVDLTSCLSWKERECMDHCDIDAKPLALCEFVFAQFGIRFMFVLAQGVLLAQLHKFFAKSDDDSLVKHEA